MNTHAVRAQDGKSESASHQASQQQNAFVDNRPEAIGQRELQAMADNSSQVRQLMVLREGEGPASGTVIQRWPVLVAGNAYRDDKYPDVTMEKVSGNIYRITKEGPYKDRQVVGIPGEDEYFEPHAEGYADEDKPFDMAQVTGGPGAVAVVPTLYDNLGEAGKGVGNVTADTTLRTTGLNTCVGWLLYNDTAAYLAHIVVSEPDNVIANGAIHTQANALAAQFLLMTGSAATTLRIQVDAGQPAYGRETVWQSAWMQELVPDGCAAIWNRGAAVLSRVVGAAVGGGVRSEWTGAPIRVAYAPKVKDEVKTKAESKEEGGGSGAPDALTEIQ